MTLAWNEVSGAEIGVRSLYDILALRGRVFVVEQQSPYLDPDGLDLDEETRHLWATQEEEIAAYARLLDTSRDGNAHLTRIIVSEAHRGLRLGHDLVDRAVAACAEHWPGADIVMSAQAHLQGFYGAHGFETTSAEYLEDGIPHVRMTLPQ